MPVSARRPTFRGDIKVNFTVAALLAGALLYLVARPLLGLHWYWAWLLAMSAVTFVLYGYDKLQSQRQEERVLRVPELTLHVAAIAGGFAGAWAGMLLLRHKTRHQIFFVVLIAATVAHAILAYVLLLPK